MATGKPRRKRPGKGGKQDPPRPDSSPQGPPDATGQPEPLTVGEGDFVTQEDIAGSFEPQGDEAVVDKTPPEAEPIQVRDEDFSQPPEPEAPPAEAPPAAGEPKAPAVKEPVIAPVTAPVATPVTAPVAATAAATAAATVAPAAGLSAFATAIKLLLIAIFLGGVGTAGFYTARHFGLLGDSPSAVVRKYYERLEAGGDISDLLSAKSKEFYSDMGLDDPDTQPWMMAVGGVYARHCSWHVQSEKIEGDRAWVMVVMETDDPIRTRLEALEAEITAKNAYNRRQGNYDLIAMNNAYLARQKQMLASPLGRRMAEALKRTEMPHMCVYENGTWKVAPAEQMDAAFENMGKNLERLFEGRGKDR